MGRRFKPLPVLEGAQGAAVDPNINASVSASAGTGKTQVLTGRVFRLLLNGADPSAILCVTFTKAGAAEMANRIGARLASFRRARLLTRDAGVVITLADGSEFQISVIQSRIRQDEEAEDTP